MSWTACPPRMFILSSFPSRRKSIGYAAFLYSNLSSSMACECSSFRSSSRLPVHNLGFCGGGVVEKSWVSQGYGKLLRRDVYSSSTPYVSCSSVTGLCLPCSLECGCPCPIGFDQASTLPAHFVVAYSSPYTISSKLFGRTPHLSMLVCTVSYFTKSVFTWSACMHF